MAMQIRCRCGANLEVPAGTPAVVCAACQATVAVPQPERELALSETVPAFVPTATTTAAPPRRSIWPGLVAVLALVGGGIAIAIYALAGDDERAAPAPRDAALAIDAAATAPAPVTADVRATSPEELVVLARAAIAAADEPGLAALLAPNAFGHGIDAGDIAYGGPAVAAMIVRMLGKPPLASTWSKIARDRDVAWIADELDAGRKRKVMTSLLAYREGSTWRIAAWHLGELLRNPVAAELANAGKLPAPAPLQNQFDDDHQVYDAFRAAFASRETFAAAFSDRADALNLGSAPGERVLGGPAIKRWASTTNHTFRLHDNVTAGRVGDRVGWAAGNVEYTLRSVQTYRVFAVLVRERAGWRIVHTQFTNAGPITD
jgi:hypothetical protein